jgi:hypothetical protein
MGKVNNGRRQEDDSPVGIRRAMVLKKRGEGKSFRQIGQELGVSHVQAREDLLSLSRSLPIEEQLELELATDLHRVDELIKSYWEDATEGKNLDAGNFILRCLDRRAKLLGLDAPKKIDIRAIVENWAIREGFDPQLTVEVMQGLLTGVG